MGNVSIGLNTYHGRTHSIEYAESDRLRHMYMIGKTGVGKSTVFQNMCLQDINNGHGVCFIDPHGESIDWLLARIPRDRLKDVVLFDPSDTAYPFALNLLEARDDFEKDFLVNETIQIFYKLFDPKKTGVIGPQFEHWLRNAALTVMAGPEGGSILEIPKLFVDREFEMKKRRHLTDPIVIDFWTKQMAKTSAVLARLREEGIPFISVLTDPVYGGVSASLAMLGDVIVGEPKALIGFAGPRVIEQTVREKLPEGFQRSEFLLEHGAIDMIIARSELRPRLGSLLAQMMGLPTPVYIAPKVEPIVVPPVPANL